MTAGIETTEVNTFIGATVNADTGAGGLATLLTGGYWAGIADVDTPAPYMTFNWMAAPDTLTVSGVRIMTAVLYRMEVLAPVDQIAAAITAANRMDTLFSLVRNQQTTNAYILSCVRTQALERYEVSEGKRWVHLGGLYRFQVQYK